MNSEGDHLRRDWTPAQRALARALASAYNARPSLIAAGVDALADVPKGIVAELASVVAEMVETGTVPPALNIVNAVRAGRAIWPEFLASLAMRSSDSQTTGLARARMLSPEERQARRSSSP